MKSRTRNLVDKSVDAMLAAIEAYNKPSFLYREEAFSILAINAWELLLKARILQLQKNQLSSILVFEQRKNADGRMSTVLYRKRNRAGNWVTISLFKAYDDLVNEHKDKIDSSIRTNLEALVEVRDNAVHFFNKDLSLERRVHEIGSAALKNYVAAIRIWFAVDLSRYRIFLMPLAFMSNLRTAEGMGLNTEERHFLKYLDDLSADSRNDPSKDFNVALTIDVRIRRTKNAEAIPVVASTEALAIPISVGEEDIREKYPWTYDILTAKLKKRYADFRANQQYHHIRKPLEADAAYCMERLLDPGNPRSIKKKFYNPNVVKEFDVHYTRGKADAQGQA